MANDRSVNITINYKVNTQDVQKAADLSVKAQKATDDLRKAAGDAGRSMSNSYKQTSATIGQLRGELSALKARIDRTAANSPALEGLKKQYQDLQKQISLTNKAASETPKALKQTSVAAKDTGMSFTELAGAVRLFLTAGIIKEAAEMALNMATLSGNVDGVSRAFTKLVPNADAVLQGLRESTHGTVDDLELMKKALQAQNFGLPVEKLGKLFEFASTKAQQTGLSIEYITNSLVTGLGRKSERVFDNLQLDIAELRKRIATGLDFRTAGIQLIEEDLERMGGFVETTATQVDQLSAAWKGFLQVASGIELNDVIKFFTLGAVDSDITFVTYLRDLTQGMKDYAETIQRGISAEELYAERQIKAIAVASEREFSQRVLTGTTEENIKAIEDEVKAITSQLGLAGKNRAYAEERIKNLKDEYKAIIEKRFASHKETEEFEKQLALEIRLRDSDKENIAIDQEILKLLVAKLNLLKKTNDETVKEIETIATLRAKLSDLEKQREEATSIYDKKQLDFLQREIILLEDRILKIADNIKWQEKWSDTKRQADFVDKEQLETMKQINDEIEKMTPKGDISFSTGDLLPTDATELTKNFDIEAIDQALKEVANLIGTHWNATWEEQEVAEKAANSLWTRFRLAFKNEGGDSSELQGMMNEAMQELKMGFIDIAADQFISIEMSEVDSLNRRLKNLQSFYDNQVRLAGDNEQAKEILRKREERQTTELQRKIFEKEKQAKRNAAIIDGAAGVVKAFASYPYPVALIISALIAAKTISQVAIINRTKPGFAKGVIDLKGPGTATSDSIPANLSRGESVVTADKTKQSKKTLRDIMDGKLNDAKYKQLNDGILSKLHVTKDGVRYDPFNDERIVAAIKNIAPHPDYHRVNNILFEQKMSADKLHKSIRLKSMG
jgi:hypothetical protein